MGLLVALIQWVLMLRWIWLPLVLGCSFEHGTVGDNADGGTSTGDGSQQQRDDAMTVLPQDCWAVPGVGVDVCLNGGLSGTVEVTSTTSIDTDSSGTGPQQCKALRAGSSDVCVIAGTSISIAATRTLSASGERPLVLIATTIQIDGTIDVASHVNGQRGPAANLAGCNAGTAPESDEGGGGQGGSLGTRGGDGGNAAWRNGSRGTAGAVLAAQTLRGGCPGATGGDGGGTGGDGGGAVLLVADSITFGTAGRINASGASGRGGS